MELPERDAWAPPGLLRTDWTDTRRWRGAAKTASLAVKGRQKSHKIGKTVVPLDLSSISLSESLFSSVTVNDKYVV